MEEEEGGTELDRLKAFTLGELSNAMALDPDRWARLMLGCLGETPEIMVGMLGLDTADETFRRRAIEFIGVDPRELVRAPGLFPSQVIIEPPLGGLETRTAVVLSTCHIDPFTAMAANNAVSVDGHSGRPEWLFRWEHGFLAYCLDDPPIQMPRSLSDCCRRIRREIGFAPDRPLYLLFDKDGPEIPGLQKYDW